MATMQFDLVSPERKLASLEASEVEIPGADGDFTAMPDHSPLLTTLRPGVLKVKAGSDVTEYVVTGGFVEVSPTATSVLAEMAVPKADASADFINGLVDDAQKAAEILTGPERDVANKRVSDTKALLDLI
ncbi:MULTISPECIES: ATP synthase F1 subunit epsilon [Rhodobacterales]|uniref:ATP synthase F1 subunit epsilon n=1 Tax=Roseobacter sp. N2S TaxID=2663844 RepID=UPI00285D1C40|nr:MULTISPECIES: ATP synthase F1 subunit epsilon [Rhodobacterales]MDR6266104.1 F-type H+-transporting ATPase subunit epsilon [Roseobacter sp. N2S]